MTVHMIRYLISDTGSSFLVDSYLPTWLTNYQAWEAVENDPPTEIVTDSGLVYYSGDWYFNWEGNSKAVLLNGITGYTQAYADWYRIGYHVCDHDEDDRGGCSWDDVREGGDIPDEIPTLAN